MAEASVPKASENMPVAVIIDASNIMVIVGSVGCPLCKRTILLEPLANYVIIFLMPNSIQVANPL